MSFEVQHIYILKNYEKSQKKENCLEYQFLRLTKLINKKYQLYLQKTYARMPTRKKNNIYICCASDQFLPQIKADQWGVTVYVLTRDDLHSNITIYGDVTCTSINLTQDVI